jgi:hypothetical protein
MSQARLMTALTQPLLPALVLLLQQAALEAGAGQPETKLLLLLLRTWTSKLAQRQKGPRVPLAGGAAAQGPGAE